MKGVALFIALSLCLVACLAAVAVAAPAEAHTLKLSTAKRYAKKAARDYYYPARVYAGTCRRRSRHRLNCFVSAFYPSGTHCIAWFHAYSPRKGRVITGGPLLERC